MRELGVGHYRLSLAWPRILPGGTGKPNLAGLGFYGRIIDRLREYGIEPWAPSTTQACRAPCSAAAVG